LRGGFCRKIAAHRRSVKKNKSLGRVS
jgi:hypothetical protein